MVRQALPLLRGAPVCHGLPGRTPMPHPSWPGRGRAVTGRNLRSMAAW